MNLQKSFERLLRDLKTMGAGMTCLSFALSEEVNMPIRTTRPYVAIRKHMQEQEIANQEQLAIDLLPRVAETNTPLPMDVAGEGLL